MSMITIRHRTDAWALPRGDAASHFDRLTAGSTILVALDRGRACAASVECGEGDWALADHEITFVGARPTRWWGPRNRAVDLVPMSVRDFACVGLAQGAGDALELMYDVATEVVVTGLPAREIMTGASAEVA